MATLINGSRVDWEAYEYGVEVNGEVFPRKGYTDALVMHQGTPTSKMKFRAVYVTEWWDGTDA